jgi:hypothetical protein
MVIRLVRITTKRITATETLAFRTVTRKNSDMYKGETKVITAGHAGKRTVVYNLTLSDGKVTDRDVVSSVVQKKPVTQVEEVGTKARPASSSSGGGSAGGAAASLNWAALAKCESGGNPNAVNPAGPYYGLYQFSASTWHSVGGSGVPTDYGASEQTYRAQLLYNKVGDSAWPSCGHHLYD